MTDSVQDASSVNTSSEAATPREIEVTELVLRDGHQSLLATRMATEDMVEACEDIDQAGFWSVECWGGATYDSCIRFLNEDPWERLRTFRKLMPNSPAPDAAARPEPARLPALRGHGRRPVRGQVGRERHGRLPRLRRAQRRAQPRSAPMDAVSRTGKHAQGTICYTDLARCTPSTRFVEMAQRLKEMGSDSICIKDMAALLRPQPAFDIVKGDQGEVRQGHASSTCTCHSTTGVTMVSLMKAIEAGADIVDTVDLLAQPGPGPQPDRGPGRDARGHAATPPGSKKDRLLKIKDHFAKVRPRYAEFESKFIGVETEIFDSQIPGGMISNMESQLKQQGAGDRVKEVLAEVPRVRKAAGYPPLVTPSSQIVGTQAVFNVLMGPYKVLTGEFADLMLGYYGETIAARDPAIIEAAAKHAKKEPITGRPADLLKPEWDELRAAALALEGLQRDRRGRPDLRHVPPGRPEVLRRAGRRAQERGQGPVRAGAPPPPSPATARPRPPTARDRSPARSPTTSRSARSRTR